MVRQSHFNEFFFFENPSELTTFVSRCCKTQYSCQLEHLHYSQLEQIVLVVLHTTHALGQAEVVSLE